MGPCSATDQTISKNKIMDKCVVLVHNYNVLIKEYYDLAS